MRWTRAIIMLGMAAGGACTRPVDLTAADGGSGPGACPELTDGLDVNQCAALRGMAFVEDLPPSRGNRYADDPQAAVFGFYNFFDTRLSGSGTFSCATCHKPEAAFQDGLPVSQAAGTGTRNAPTTLLAARVTTWFWDGRADALWSVPLFAIENPVELDQTRLALAHHVAADPAMRAQYEAAFGPMPDLSDTARFPPAGKPGDARWDGMTADDQRTINRVFVNIGKSLEAFMRKSTAGPAPFDRFLGGDPAAISTGARRALRTYATDCVGCHGGPALTDLRFMDFAFADAPGIADPGRHDAVAILLSNPLGVHGEFADPVNIPGFPALDPSPTAFLHEFRTPSLRDTAITAPYIHSGQVPSLRDMVNHIRTLDSGETDDLVELMNAFTGAPPPAPWNAAPTTPRPTP